MPLRVALTGGPSSSAETSAVPGGGRDPLRSDGDERRAQGNRVEAQPMVDAERRDHHRLENLKKRLENVIENSPVLKSFRPQLLIDMTTEGLRIQIIDNQNRPMFATGRAEVQPYMRDILRELGPVLNELPNKVSISAIPTRRNTRAGSAPTATGNCRPTAPTRPARSWWPAA